MKIYLDVDIALKPGFPATTAQRLYAEPKAFDPISQPYDQLFAIHFRNLVVGKAEGEVTRFLVFKPCRQAVVQGHVDAKQRGKLLGNGNLTKVISRDVIRRELLPLRRITVGCDIVYIGPE